MKIRLFTLILLFFNSTQVFSGNSGTRTISRVEASDTFFTIYSSGTAFDNTEGCEDTTKVVFWAVDAPDGHKKMMSLAISAMMSGKQVSMWFNGCKMGPWNKTLPTPTTINIYN